LPSPQLFGQAPQSLAQLLHVSPALASQVPLPQTPLQPPPQSAPQAFTQILSHAVLQQNGSFAQTQASQPQPSQPGVLVGVQPSLQAPQSFGQLLQLSPTVALHTPSPQASGWQGPQSFSQVLQLSPATGLHTPSPHACGQEPQSAAQLLHVSPSLGVHRPSPHLPGQAPQSPGQVAQLSPLAGAHRPSPH
jgi:hypothetical protein